MSRRAEVLLTLAVVACATPPTAAPREPAASPAPTADPARTTAALFRDDLRYFAQTLPRVHLNLFHSTSPATWQAAIAALDAKLDALTPARFEVELLRLVALTGDGHTQLQSPYAGTDIVPVFHEFPLVLHVFSDGMFVQQAAPEFARLVGTRVIAIGGTPIDAAIERVVPLIDRDSDAMLPWYTARYLVVPEIDEAVGVIDSVARATFTFTDGDATLSVDLPARAIAPHAGWADARAATTRPTPLYLRDPANAYWASRIGDEAVYLQWNVVLPKPGADESIFGFFSRVLQEIDARPVRKLIIDVRFNQGGERYYVDPVVEQIAARAAFSARGSLFVITGRRTFSSGVVFCALMRRRTNAIFIGEPASSRPNQYATISRVVLPNTKLVIGASTQYNQDAEPGDERPWIVPDIPVALSSRDYLTNADPVLAAALVWTP